MATVKQKKHISVPDQHRIKIAKKTLRLSEIGARILGGMDHGEARRVLKEFGYSDAAIKRLENPESLQRLRKTYGVTGKLSKSDARDLLRKAGIDPNADYFTLRSSEVSTVVDVGRLAGYRHRDVSGKSFGRAFLDALGRGKNPSLGSVSAGALQKKLDQAKERATKTYWAAVKAGGDNMSERWNDLRQRLGDAHPAIAKALAAANDRDEIFAEIKRRWGTDYVPSSAIKRRNSNPHLYADDIVKAIDAGKHIVTWRDGKPQRSYYKEGGDYYSELFRTGNIERIVSKTALYDIAEAVQRANFTIEKRGAFHAVNPAGHTYRAWVVDRENKPQIYESRHRNKDAAIKAIRRLMKEFTGGKIMRLDRVIKGEVRTAPPAAWIKANDGVANPTAAQLNRCRKMIDDERSTYGRPTITYHWKNGDTLTGYKMGDFVEFFGEDAKRAAALFKLTITARTRGDHAGQPMTGFPEWSLDEYKAIAKKHGVTITVKAKNPRRKTERKVYPAMGTLTRDELAELINIWHTSRTHSSSRHERMLYTTEWFHKDHPQYTSMTIYKTLDRQLKNPTTSKNTYRLSDSERQRGYRGAIYRAASKAGYALEHDAPVTVNLAGNYAIVTLKGGHKYKARLTPKGVAAPRTWTATTLENPDVKNPHLTLLDLKTKIKEFPYGMPKDQLTSAMQTLLRKYPRHFENDSGYIKVRKTERGRKNPATKSALVSLYKNLLTRPITSENLGRIRSLGFELGYGSQKINADIDKMFKQSAAISARQLTDAKNPKMFAISIAPKNSQSRFPAKTIKLEAANKTRALAQAKAQVKYFGENVKDYTFRIVAERSNPLKKFRVWFKSSRNSSTAERDVWADSEAHAKRIIKTEHAGQKIIIVKVRGYVNDVLQNPPKQRAKNFSNADFRKFTKDRLLELSKMFQGRANGAVVTTEGSDAMPNDTFRLGYLVKLIYRDASGRKHAISFDGDAFVSGDLRCNLWFSGRDVRIAPATGLPKKPHLIMLGDLVQVEYVTAKKHIENGQTVRFWHPMGEVTRAYPKLAIDYDGFPIAVGGGYDIWDVGIVN